MARRSITRNGATLAKSDNDWTSHADNAPANLGSGAAVTQPPLNGAAIVLAHFSVSPIYRKSIDGGVTFASYQDAVDPASLGIRQQHLWQSGRGTLIHPCAIPTAGNNFAQFVRVTPSGITYPTIGAVRLGCDSPGESSGVLMLVLQDATYRWAWSQDDGVTWTAAAVGQSMQGEANILAFWGIPGGWLGLGYSNPNQSLYRSTTLTPTLTGHWTRVLGPIGVGNLTEPTAWRFAQVGARIAAIVSGGTIQRIYFSDDQGGTWTQATTPPTSPWTIIPIPFDRFAALNTQGGGFTQEVWTSIDANTWTDSGSSVGGAATGNLRFVPDYVGALNSMRRLRLGAPGGHKLKGPTEPE